MTPSRGGEGAGPSAATSRDQEAGRQASSTTSSNRTGHTRQTSESTTNGTSAQSTTDDRQLNHHHNPPRQRKTTIHGATGTWVLGKTIGAGSMGKVKLAKKQDGTEQVAVKIVPRHLIHDRGIDPATGAPLPPRHDDSKEIRTAREAAIVTLLDHPYICGMRDVIKTNNHWYMLCEYVNGGQMLDYIISHGRLKEKQARKFGRQIASALDYCHRNSIVHRDLKIENILISKTGDIKIIDFGLSNLFAPRSHLKTFCGSLYFAAPELLQAKQYVGPEVDVWSFGIVLYVLVCGKVPFDDQSMPALHAKIKKGVVDYPQWLSLECRNILSRMLVTEPRARATLAEIIQHPWLNKGFTAPPENHLPLREPITLPLDPAVINGMTGFEFGTSEAITAQMTKIIESEDYQSAVRNASRDTPLQSPTGDKKKSFGFDFYKRRSSTSSKDTLTNPSTEVLSHPYIPDPLNAYHPLVSVYYLVKEKLERDRQILNGGAQPPLPTPDVEKIMRLPIPKQPEVAHTSETSYEMKGDASNATAGVRTRPRARTHGDEEVSEAMKKVNLGIAGSVPPTPAVAAAPVIKEEPIKRSVTAAGLFRKFSTRRGPKPPPTPTLSLQGPGQSSPVELPPPRKSLSLRRRDPAPPPTIHSGGSQPQHKDLLTPPTTADDSSSKKSSKLGRSTSVSEADWRKRYGRGESSKAPVEAPPPTSGSDHSSTSKTESTREAAPTNPQKVSLRTKSLGHARRESYQGRRNRRDESGLPENVPEEETTESNGAATGGAPAESSTLSSDFVKPVYLKGLFSVSTTSTKPPLAIRADIIRVLDQLGVSYREIKGGFSCVHRPSIDLKSVVDNPTPAPEPTNMVSTPSHRRKLSFAGSSNQNSSNGPSGTGQASPTKMSRRGRTETSYSNSDVSSDEVQESALGGSLILNFEIYLVKIPLLSLHGIQFKSVNKTNTWQYKSLASKILSELRL
ncbi:kinase-like domain-containing protein [Peziza echinospora]|nr:kinase-like domain-containing protein [Peziza echinospora]